MLAGAPSPVRGRDGAAPPQQALNSRLSTAVGHAGDAVRLRPTKKPLSSLLSPLKVGSPRVTRRGAPTDILTGILSSKHSKELLEVVSARTDFDGVTAVSERCGRCLP